MTATDHGAPPSRLAIAGLLVVLALSAMDATIMNTAMPVVAAAIGGMALYPWTFSAFMLASTVVMPFFGKFADHFGTRRCLFATIAVFLLGSALCGLAPTMPALIAARVVQGIGVGGINTLVFVAFGLLFPPEKRGQAQTLFAVVWGASTLVGPLAGGLMVSHFPWPWVFWINLPAGLLAVAFLASAFPGGGGAGGALRLAWLDGVLLAAGLVATLLAFGDHGGATAQAPAWLMGALGVAILGWFVARQAIAPAPLVPTTLFRGQVFGVCAAVGVGSCLTMFAALTYVPLLCQGAWGLSAAEAGAAVTPMMFSWPAGGMVAGFLVNRLGFRTQVVFGAALMVVAYMLLWQGVGPHTVGAVAASAALLGAGMGFITSTTMVAAQVSVPRRVIGVASSTLGLVRNVAASLSVVALGAWQLRGFSEALATQGLALSADQIAALVQPGASVAAAAIPPALVEPARAALELSIRGVFGVSLGIALLTLVVACFMPPWSPAEAARHAAARDARDEERAASAVTG